MSPRLIPSFIFSIFTVGFCLPAFAGDPIPVRDRPIRVQDTVSGGRLTLEQAYDRALATDQTIKIAYWEIRKANLLPWSALAKLGPQLSASGSYERFADTTKVRTTKTVTQVVNGLVTPVTNVVDGVTTPVVTFLDQSTRSRGGNGEGGLSYVQPLIDFTVFPAYHLGSLTRVATRLEHQYTVRETLFGLASAFYEVLKQQQLVVVDKETLRLSSEQLDLAQKRANVGEVTRTDVLRAEVTVESARETLVQDQGLLDIDRNSLANILNFAPDTPFTVIEPPDYPGTVASFAKLLGSAYAHREDLKVADIAIDQDIARRDEVVGQYGPRLNAQIDGEWIHNSGGSNSSVYDTDVIFSVSVPIFTGGQREVDLLTANRQIEETKLNREKTAKQVEADVKSAVVSVQTLQQTLKALHAQVVAAEQGYHDLENEYRAGTATSVDVLTALDDLNTARKNLAVQIYGFQVALRSVEQATGVFQEARVKRSKIR